MVCFMYRFNSFSPGQKAIHVGITRGFESPRFLPLSFRIILYRMEPRSRGIVHTRLRSFLSRDFLFYTFLRRIILGQNIAFATQLLRNTSVTMFKSGFGPYHGLWLDGAPTKPIDIIPTPWMMTRALGFIEILQVHK
jgi:hypothetical protein